jgi:hypothetical protein
MQSRGKNKQTRNYLNLLPADPLARIIFYLPEAARRTSIAKMPEFNEALLKHDENMKNIAQKALELIKEDKDFKAASALVEKHSRLLTREFCSRMLDWMNAKELLNKTTELAEILHDSAKEFDSTCTVGTIPCGVTTALERYIDPDLEDYALREVVVEDYAKVIWIKFGDVTVHYWFTPGCVTYECEGSFELCKLELSVYKYVAADRYIRGVVVCDWEESVDFNEVKYETSCSIRQYGVMENSEEMFSVLGTAIGLAAGVGMWSPATALAHRDVPKGDLGTIENIACALQFAGRSFKSLAVERYYDLSDFPAVMC